MILDTLLLLGLLGLYGALVHKMYCIDYKVKDILERCDKCQNQNH